MCWCYITFLAQSWPVRCVFRAPCNPLGVLLNSLTVSKSQFQIVKGVDWTYLRRTIVAHGQLYVAASQSSAKSVQSSKGVLLSSHVQGFFFFWYFFIIRQYTLERAVAGLEQFSELRIKICFVVVEREVLELHSKACKRTSS